MKNVLVTGGTGVIGSHVTKKLAESEFVKQVVAYDLFPNENTVNNRNEDIVLEKGDIRDFPNLLRVLNQYEIDRVVHTAALLSNHCRENPYKAIEVNILPTVYILEAARILNLDRVVYCSSKAVYGEIEGEHGRPNYTPVTENHCCNPKSVYGLTKFSGEQFGIIYNELFDVNFTSCRFASIYGPDKEVRHGPMAIASEMINAAINGDSYTLEEGGDQVDDWIYVKDAARALVQCCLKEQIKHNVFNIGSGEGITPKLVAKTLEEILPQADIQVNDGYDYFDSDLNCYCIYDTERAKGDLEFETTYDLKSGLQDYINEKRGLEHE